VPRIVRTLVAVVALLTVAATAGAAPTHAPLLAYSVALNVPNHPGVRHTGIVYLARPNGSDRRRYGSGNTPMLSADGSQVAFTLGVYARPQTVVVGSTAGPSRQRFMLPARSEVVGWAGPSVVIQTEGTGLLLLAPPDVGLRTIVPATFDGDRTPLFAGASPDGQQLLVLGQGHGFGQTGSDLFVVDVADGTIHPLTTDGTSDWAVWGPEGIAYADGGVHGDIWIVQPDGSGLHQLTQTHAGIWPIAFDAAGDRLLAANLPLNNGRLWAVHVASGAARALTGWQGELSALSISRDGKTVYAESGCGETVGGVGQLESFPFAGGRPRVFARGACFGSWSA
jgi:hypothetical protein